MVGGEFRERPGGAGTAQNGVAAADGGAEVGGDDHIVGPHGGMGGGESGLELGGGPGEGVGIEVAFVGGEEGTDDVAGDEIVLWGDAGERGGAGFGEVDDLVGMMGIKVAGEGQGSAGVVERFGEGEERGEFGEADGFVGEGLAGMEVDTKEMEEAVWGFLREPGKLDRGLEDGAGENGMEGGEVGGFAELTGRLDEEADGAGGVAGFWARKWSMWRREASLANSDSSVASGATTRSGSAWRMTSARGSMRPKPPSRML